jgi:hypothetical protein
MKTLFSVFFFVLSFVCFGAALYLHAHELTLWGFAVSGALLVSIALFANSMLKA